MKWVFNKLSLVRRDQSSIKDLERLLKACWTHGYFLK